MKVIMGVALLLAPALAAQQPAPSRTPAPPPRADMPAPPMGGRLAPGGARVTGFAVGMFNPSHLLERRETLDLTPEQVTRLSTLETELRAAQEKTANDAKPQREELEKLLEQSAPDVTQVRTRAQALMQAEQAMRLATLTTAVQAKAVLTAEQRGRVQGWADGGRAVGMRRPGMAPRMRRPAGPGPQQFRRGMIRGA